MTRRSVLLASASVVPVADVAPANARAPIDSGDPPINTVITLQRGACERRCAVYRLVIFADGTVIYEGRYHVRKQGVTSRKLDVAAVQSLIRAFLAIGYFDLSSEYGHSSLEGCESEADGVPRVMTSIVLGTKSKAIVHHHRCLGPIPTKLRELENEIDRTSNSARWVN